jgi:coenzyme F420-reducing hydrogenase delta subunit
MNSSEFEPQIIGFCCHYCAYAAADLAGISRLQYPPNVKLIKLPCSGRVDIIYLLQAFEKGADGVFVAGCLEGECHFLNGNIRAKKRVEYTKNLLKEIGIEPERLAMYNLSASMGKYFAELVTEMTEKIRKLGPNPLSLKPR